MSRPINARLCQAQSQPGTIGNATTNLGHPHHQLDSIFHLVYLLQLLPKYLETMLFRSVARATRTASAAVSMSSVAGRRFASSLVFLEQKGGKLNDAALCAVTAAQSVGGDVSVIVNVGHLKLTRKVAGIVIGSKSDVDAALAEVKG